MRVMCILGDKSESLHEEDKMEKKTIVWNRTIGFAVSLVVLGFNIYRHLNGYVYQEFSELIGMSYGLLIPIVVSDVASFQLDKVRLGGEKHRFYQVINLALFAAFFIMLFLSAYFIPIEIALKLMIYIVFPVYLIGGNITFFIALKNGVSVVEKGKRGKRNKGSS